MDLRYLNRPGVEAEVATCRSDILSFLSEIYNSIAETLPDFRDDTFDVETSLEIVKPDVDTADPYSEATAAATPSPVGNKCKKKNTKRSVQVNPDRVAEPGGPCEQRYLPPGQMKDYWEMYKKRQCVSSRKPASFPTFWKDPCLNSLRRSLDLLCVIVFFGSCDSMVT